MFWREFRKYAAATRSGVPRPRRVARLPAVALLGLLAGQTDQQPPAPKHGEPFEVKAGDTRRLADDTLSVRFDRVTEDSRCPVGVQCVWEGDAVVQLTLERPPATAEARVLHTSQRFERETEYAGLIVRLVDLQPEPREGATIAPEDYRVKLIADDTPKKQGDSSTAGHSALRASAGSTATARRAGR
jgi:hypothetical protein